MADLTPNDIVNTEFRTAFRGYAPEQVDDFLQMASDSLYRALEENQRLRAQVEDLRTQVEQYRRTEEMIKNALLLAERTADEARQRAQQEVDLMRREAEQRMQGERLRVEELRQLRLRILAELRATLHTHLSMLEAQESTPEAMPCHLSEGEGYGMR